MAEIRHLLGGPMLKPPGNGFEMIEFFPSKERSVRILQRQIPFLVVIDHFGLLNPDSPALLQALKDFERMLRHGTKGFCNLRITSDGCSGFLQPFIVCVVEQLHEFGSAEEPVVDLLQEVEDDRFLPHRLVLNISLSTTCLNVE